jgi:hypothetical protein
MNASEELLSPSNTSTSTDTSTNNATSTIADADADAAFPVANNITLNSTTFSAPPSSSLMLPSPAGAADPTTILLSLGWVILLMYCACRIRQAPSLQDHWLGQEVRERARRNLQQRRELREKEQQSPEDRRALVSSSLRTKRVLAQDEDGNMTLGNINSSSDDEASPQQKNSFPPAAPDCHDDEDDEEHACVICLEPFQVGDVVSWSRFSKTCHHVFHTDCIQPWLEDKRHDDCPSCRTTLIVNHKEEESHATTPPTTTTTTQKDEENQIYDNDRDDHNEDETEEDSFFVIVHGLISRAAQQASYTLRNTKDSKCEDLPSKSQN